MTEALGNLLTHDHAHQLALTLVHTLWQAAVIAVALHWLVLRRLSARSANGRYAASVFALVLVLLAGLATWSALAWEPARGDVAPAPAMQDAAGRSQAAHRHSPPDLPSTATATTNVGGTSGEPAANAFAPQPAAATSPEPAYDWQTVLVLLYLAGVLLMLLRAGQSLTHIHLRLVRTGEAPEPVVVRAVDTIRRTLAIRRFVRVLISDRVTTPAVVGAIWPVLLLPASAITGLTPQQLRLVIAHELAHVRRHDYLVNLLQLLIEALLFFNPAVWWMSRQVRIEREACCDALAAAAVSSSDAGAADVQHHRHAMAEALLRFVDRDRGRGPALQSIEGSNMFDRIRRLVLPDARPAVRLPWYSLAGLTAVCVLLLGGLHAATDATVHAIAQALTAEQRIERLREAREAHAPLVEDREYTEADNLTVAGRVRTADGRPLPHDAGANVRSARPRYSAGYSVGGLRDGAFEHAGIDYGSVEVTAWAEGYAPALVGPFVTEPGGRIDDIEVVLDRGFTGRIALLGRDDEPLPDIELSYAFWAGSRSISRGSTITDEQGIAVIEHAADFDCRIDLRVPGYEFEQRIFQLTPDDVLPWRLTPARPAAGTVTDAVTGEPIANAGLYLARRQGHAARTRDPRPQHGGRRDEPLAVTDENGRFELTSLRDDSTYTFWIEADGHAVKMTDRIAPAEDLNFALGPELYIEGEITAGLDRLHTRGGARDAPDRGRLFFHWYNTIQFNGRSHSHTFSAYVDVDEEGVGRFRITRLLPGRVALQLPGRNVDLEISDHPITDLSYDLTQPDEAEEPELRRLVVRLSVDEDDPEPRGTIHVQSNLQGHGPIIETVELAHGRAEIDVHVGGRTMIQAHDLIGYWFPDMPLREVAPGDEPLTVTIPALPAGMIVGRVFGVDGETPAAHLDVSLVAIDQPELPTGQHFNRHMDVRAGVNGRYALGPIPLGGTYAVRATRGRGNFVLSEPVQLDAADPVRQIDLQMSETADAELVVLGPEGDPQPRVEVSLSYSGDYGGTGFSPDERTDSRGRIVFTDLDPNLPGTFHARIDPRRDYQPARQPLRFDGEPTVIQLQRGRTLEGVVIDRETGSAIEGVELWATPQDPPHRMFHPESTTDRTGRFRFSNLAPGAYRITILGGATRDRRDLHAVAGQPDALRIEIDIEPIRQEQYRIVPQLQ